MAFNLIAKVMITALYPRPIRLLKGFDILPIGVLCRAAPPLCLSSVIFLFSAIHNPEIRPHGQE
jgi:hypothetical protein